VIKNGNEKAGGPAQPGKTNGNGKGRSNGNGKSNGHANGSVAPERPSVLQKPKRLPSAHAVQLRFGAVLGKRFARKNLPVLQQVHAAYTGLRRAAALIRGRGANIFTQWVGDPDALGSAVMLRAILLHLGAKEVRILTGSLGHPQNRNLVARCGLELHEPNTGRVPRGLHCMVDASPPLGLGSTGRIDPVSDFFFVADHHADPDDVEEQCRARGVKRVRHAFVGLPVGSTSSFVAALGLVLGAWESLGAAGRAAAALGIYTDTSALLHGAAPIDFRMFEKLTRDAATQEVLDDLRDYRVPPEWFAYRAAAFQNQQTTGGVRIAPVGYVRDAHRDVIAEIASELLRVEGTSIAIAVAVTSRGTEASVRGDSRLLGEDRTRIVRVIDFLLSHAFPGVSGFKYAKRPPHRVEGGACVPHDEARMRLWSFDTLEAADGQAMLEQCRACARALVAALQDLKVTRPEDVQGLL
jgi:nanoRNase/pAp phosphatase (c-di-AMP/oligoRNAs hydrolase)